MVKEIRITNVQTDESIVLTKDGKEGYVIDNIDWSSPEVQRQTFKIPYQIGEFVEGQTIGVRNPSIIGYVIADIEQKSETWEQYLKEQETILEDLKEKLDKVCNIQDDLLIEVNGYKLKARMESPIRYSINEDENNEVLCMFYLQCICYEPMFYKESTNVSLAVIDGKFLFPLEIPKGKDFVFGEIAKKKAVEIKNKGDIDAGCIINIKAIGGIVKNPKIYNINSGEFFELENVQIDDGDYVIINTNVGCEDVYIFKSKQSKKQSLIGFIKNGSSFFKIKRGTNIYAYSVDDMYINNISVSVEFTEQFINIRGM